MKDPKKIHTKKVNPKCRVNGCSKTGFFINGICDRCKKRMISKPKKAVKQVSNNSYPKALKEAKRVFQLLRRVQEADLNGVCKSKNLDMMSPTTNQEYVDWFIAKYGQSEYDRLNLQKNLKVKFSAFELIEMTKVWNIEIERIKKEKGLK